MTAPKVLLIGSGGREFAIGRKLAQSPQNPELYFAPGNAGTLQMGQNISLPVPGTYSEQPVWDDYFDKLIELCWKYGIDMVVISPEAALGYGIVDRLTRAGIRAFGPTAAAARVEKSKSWAKELMVKLGIPTPNYNVFWDQESTNHYLQGNQTYPVVIKDDDFAEGKGVTVANNLAEALAAAEIVLTRGHAVLIEEFKKFKGEVSAFLFTDGVSGRIFGLATDYKAIYPGGPNTGGIGAYSPVPWVSARAEKDIWWSMQEMVAGLATEGAIFRGCLFGGVGVDEYENIWFLEFNCRPGDPETQELLERFEGDLLAVLFACTNDSLDAVSFKMSDEFVVGVVLCSGGYPGTYQTGYPITGLNQVPAGVEVMHAGTRLDGDTVVTGGGRVLTVVGRGPTLGEARAKAYEGVDQINFQDKYHRSDIALI